MKLSEIFTKAGEQIKARKETYICYAIEQVKGASPATRDQASGIISIRLGSVAFYDTWVAEHHPHLVRDLTLEQRRAKARIARIAWCKALAAEFKAKGD